MTPRVLKLKNSHYASCMMRAQRKLSDCPFNFFAPVFGTKVSPKVQVNLADMHSILWEYCEYSAYQPRTFSMDQSAPIFTNIYIFIGTLPHDCYIN